MAASYIYFAAVTSAIATSLTSSPESDDSRITLWGQLTGESLNECKRAAFLRYVGSGACSNTDETSKRWFAIQMSVCHFADAGRPHETCDGLYPGHYANCTERMKDPQFQAFTSYVLHADVICYHLEHRNWQAQAQQLVRGLVKQGNETAYLLAALGQTTHVVATKVKQLDTLSDTIQQRLANASEIASDIAATRHALTQFGENFRKQEEQTMASYSVVARALNDVRDLSETAVRLQGSLYANVLTFQSIGFYAAALILAWFATSVPSTSGARLPLLLLVASVFWAEYRLVQWFTLAAQQATGSTASSSSAGVAFSVPSTLQDAVEVAAALFGTTPGSLRGFTLPTTDPSLYPSYQPPQQCVEPLSNGAAGTTRTAYARPWWCVAYMIMPAAGELVRLCCTYALGTGLWMAIRVALLLVAATWWTLRLCAHIVGLTEGGTPAFLNTIDTAFLFSDASKWHMAEARWAVRCGLCIIGLFLLWRAYRSHIDHAKAVYTMLQKNMQLQNGAAYGALGWPLHRSDAPAPLPLTDQPSSGTSAVGIPLPLRDVDAHLARSIAALRINQPMTVLNTGYVVTASSALEEELDGDYVPPLTTCSAHIHEPSGPRTGTEAGAGFDMARLRPRHPATGQAVSRLPPLFALPAVSTSSSHPASASSREAQGQGEGLHGTSSAYAHINPIIAYETSAAFTQLVLLQEAANTQLRALDLSELANASTSRAGEDEEEDVDGLGWADDWSTTQESDVDMDAEEEDHALLAGRDVDDDDEMGERSTESEVGESDDGVVEDNVGAGTGLALPASKGRAAGRKSLLPQIGLLTTGSSSSGARPGAGVGGTGTAHDLMGVEEEEGEGEPVATGGRHKSAGMAPRAASGAGGAGKRKRASVSRPPAQEQSVVGEEQGLEVLDIEGEEDSGQVSSTVGTKAKRRRTGS